MKFRNDEHKAMFNEFYGRMKKQDAYHEALAYLLALNNDVVQERTEEVYFDFDEDRIKKDALEDGECGSTRRIITLAFHLWNDSNEANITDVFGYISDKAEYLFEAIRIRFRVRK